MGSLFDQPGIRAFFDGACEPVNPGGTARWAFVLLQEDKTIHVGKGIYGTGNGMTNNVAEYVGLIECMRFLLQNYPDDPIKIYGDSDMVVKMVNGTWGHKKPHAKVPHLIPLLMEARELYRKLGPISLSWVPREENELADSYTKADVDLP